MNDFKHLDKCKPTITNNRRASTQVRRTLTAMAALGLALVRSRAPKCLYKPQQRPHVFLQRSVSAVFSLKYRDCTDSPNPLTLERPRVKSGARC
jgi:hypothetical protein